MPTDRIDVFVSPGGSPHGDGSAGYPVPDLATAIDLLRRRRDPGEPAVVWVAPGRYPMRRPLELGPDDSYTSFIALDPDDPPVFEGAVTITGWQEIEREGRRLWCADAPSTCGRSFYVAGERRPRPRYPRDGFLRVADQPGLDLAADMVGTLFQGTDEFRYHDGDVPDLQAPSEVEVVVPHYWIQERTPITWVDSEGRTIHTRFRTIFALRDDVTRTFARYYLDNVIDVLGEVPGEWYHDVATSRLFYVPRPDEELESFAAQVPVLDRFVVVRGRLQSSDFVRSVRFEGLRFRYADFAELHPARPPFEVREDPALAPDARYAASPQAAADVAAAFEFIGARGCAMVDCVVEHVGGYAVEFGYGCQGNLLSGNTYSDLGAGAVKLSGSTSSDDAAFTAHNEISDNEIRSGGKAYPHAVAVLARHTAGNLIAHNHIHDFGYTGISCGWSWDYDDSPSRDNIIEGNHIHHIGSGLLSDLGGIYLLGVAPGTVVRGNLIHDVVCANYGGWGIYLDAGSSHVVVERNVCHHVASQCLHLHFGRENIVRHNVFAHGRHGAVAITRPEPHVSLTFERNVVVTDGTPVFCGTPGRRGVCSWNVESDLNLVWDSAGTAMLAGDGQVADSGEWTVVDKLDAEWRSRGRDVHTLTADPRLGDDFLPTRDSPACGLGIRTPSEFPVGPRPVADRTHPLAKSARLLGIRPSDGRL